MDILDKFFQKVESLQKKPAHVRQRILLATTGVFSVLIFFFWLSIFPATLEKVERRSIGGASSTSPFAALIGTVREAGAGLSFVKEGFGEQMHYVKEQVPPREAIKKDGLKEETSIVPLATSSLKDAQE